jgi:hypothetical protein
MEKTNEELVDAPETNTQYEFMRRQTVAQQETAQAAKETAIYTRQNACYMLASVIVLTLASVGTFILALLTYLR